MQDDIIKAYCKVYGKAWTQQEAYELTVKQPAPRFYVSAKQAYQIIARMMKGNFRDVNKMQDNRKRMYYELYEVVTRLSESRSLINKSLWYIMPLAVTSPATEFFVTPGTVARIRAWIKDGKIEECGRTVPSEAMRKSYERLKKRRAHEKRRA